MRGTRYHRMHYVRLPRRTRALIWLGLVCLLVVGGCCLALMHMRPILTSLARSRVSNSVSRIVVAAVNDAVELRSFQEIIPSMNDIFIRAVSGNL